MYKISELYKANIYCLRANFELLEKGLRGRPGGAFVTTLNKDITRTRLFERHFFIQTMKKKGDLELMKSIARDRKASKKMSEIVCLIRNYMQFLCRKCVVAFKRTLL